MNIYDIIEAETYPVSASCASQLSDMFNGKDKEFVIDCYFFCKEFREAILRGERMIEFYWYNRLHDKMVKHLISLGYVVEKYGLCENALMPYRLSDDTPNNEVRYWVVRW